MPHVGHGKASDPSLLILDCRLIHNEAIDFNQLLKSNYLEYFLLCDFWNPGLMSQTGFSLSCLRSAVCGETLAEIKIHPNSNQKNHLIEFRSKMKTRMWL